MIAERFSQKVLLWLWRGSRGVMRRLETIYAAFGGRLKTQHCPVNIARCDLLAAIFVMWKILTILLFVARRELVNNSGVMVNTGH